MLAEAYALADELANGPSIAHCVTKRQLDAEWNMSIEQALEAEARAQARCMETKDFHRAYEAFANKAEAGVQGRLMPDRGFLAWPFFEPKHRELAEELETWCDGRFDDAEPSTRTPPAVRWCAEYGAAGFLKLTVGDADHRPDVRSLALCREILARHHGLADFAFAMQGLGSGAISLFGTVEQKREWLPKVARGEAIAAFAMTEPECGSDAANMQTSAMRDGNEWVLVGEKTLISNGGIADFYVTFARTGEGEGARGLSAFIVPADAVAVSSSGSR